jgi:hypothetical protein
MEKYFIKQHTIDLRMILKEANVSLSYSVNVEYAKLLLLSEFILIKLILSCMDLLLKVLEISGTFFIDTLPYLDLLQSSMMKVQRVIYENETDKSNMVNLSILHF